MDMQFATSREVEASLLNRCTDAVQGFVPMAVDQREANVFRVASMVVRSEFPRESESLMRASEQYFFSHPGESLPPVEMVRSGWVMSLPRLRDMLSRRLTLLNFPYVEKSTVSHAHRSC